jgi:hypothetical protein
MLRAVSRVVLTMGVAALGAAAAVTMRADLLVGYGVDKALEAHNVVLPFEAAAQTGRPEKAEVGDEGYWLTPTKFDGRAPLHGHLAVGNRITISGGDGRARTLEVVGITMIGAPLLKVAADGATVRLMRVTARVVGSTEPGRDELVRFYVEVEKPKPADSLQVPQAPLNRT